MERRVNHDSPSTFDSNVTADPQRIRAARVNGADADRAARGELCQREMTRRPLPVNVESE